MKKTIFYLAFIMILVMFVPSCKTAFVWDPIGDWTLSIIIPAWERNWTETVAFNGYENGGALSGWETFNGYGTDGTWSKTGDFTLTINLDSLKDDWHNVMNFTCTSSETNPNSMTATGTLTIYHWGTLQGTYSISFTGTKTTNLQ